MWPLKEKQKRKIKNSWFTEGVFFMVEKEKVYYEFTGSVDDRNRVVIPNAIAFFDLD